MIPRLIHQYYIMLQSDSWPPLKQNTGGIDNETKKIDKTNLRHTSEPFEGQN